MSTQISIIIIAIIIAICYLTTTILKFCKNNEEIYSHKRIYTKLERIEDYINIINKLTTHIDVTTNCIEKLLDFDDEQVKK